MAHIEDTIPPVYEAGIKRIQTIVGAVLFYGRAVDKELLVTLNYIGTHQAAATEATNEAVPQLLDYLATYPNDGIVYQARNTILAAHSDAEFHNESKGRSEARAHIFLSENNLIPRWNGHIFSNAQVIKFFLTSSAEAELDALYITVQKLVPMRQTLIEMGLPQPPTLSKLTILNLRVQLTTRLSPKNI